LIFKHCVHEELIAVSPCASLDKKLVIGGKREPRKRVLTDGEIALLWQASHRLEYPEGHLYRWLLLSGCRLTEASGAHWSEFNFDQNVWTVPPERFKANETHVLPLTDTMLALLASIPRNGPWVFSHDGAVAMNGFSKVKSKVDAIMGDVPGWVNHDLRRTVRTNLAALNIADHVAEATVGHGRKGIQRVYDQWRYLPQIREALAAWHARLAAIVGDQPEPQPGNVVPLRRRARLLLTFTFMNTIQRPDDAPFPKGRVVVLGSTKPLLPFPGGRGFRLWRACRQTTRLH